MTSENNDPKPPAAQPTPAHAGAPASDDPEVLREQIADTREQLGDTVEALANKADVKAQVKDKVDAQKETLQDAQRKAQTKVKEVGAQVQQRPQPYLIGAGAALLLIAVVVRRRRR